MSPFEVLHGYKPRKPVDLIPLPMHARVSEPAESFAHYVHSLHQVISKRIEASNIKYITYDDKHRCLQEFNEGDIVIVRIRPEWYPFGTVKK